MSKRPIMLAALGAPAVLAATLLGPGMAQASSLPPPSVSTRPTGVSATKPTSVSSTGTSIGFKTIQVYAGPPTQESNNWSGYVTPYSPGSDTSVQTFFTVPTVTCGESVSMVAFWPGLDGDGNSTVEQEGVDAYCPGGDAPAEYSAWLENYPAPQQELTNTSTGAPVPVEPGDVIATEVQELSPTDYEYDIVDTAENWSLDADLPMPSGYSGQDATAEVIAEAPTNGTTGQEYTLAQFSPVTFTDSYANPFDSAAEFFSSADAAQIDMYPNGSTEADTVGALDSEGDFSITYGYTPPPPAPEVAVPSVVGRTDLALADSIITGAGLNVANKGASGAGNHGEVTAESPPAGTMVAKGTTVTLTYTQTKFPVPNVVGLALDKAQQELTKDGFKSVFTTSGKVKGGAVRVVISESPKEGTYEAKGTLVKLVVKDT